MSSTDASRQQPSSLLIRHKKRMDRVDSAIARLKRAAQAASPPRSTSKRA
jgi:hypothetical protein